MPGASSVTVLHPASRVPTAVLCLASHGPIAAAVSTDLTSAMREMRGPSEVHTVSATPRVAAMLAPRISSRRLVSV